MSRAMHFLGPEATAARLIRATAANHRAWMAAGALSGGGEVRRTGGVSWDFAPRGGADLPFPRLPSATAGETLDSILADCRNLGVREVSCWAVTPTRPRDLGARLAARGFEWGWQPHWMALDLERIPAVPVPDGLRIGIDDEADWDVDDLPYYSRPKKKKAHPVKVEGEAQRIRHFGAWLGGQIVGHCVLHLTTGAWGVAGLYSVGVVPSARRQGIGAAVTLAACEYARTLGCRWATLNAATHLYNRLGFISLGWGQTWWMHKPALKAPPPSASEVAFAEANGRGDIHALKSLHTRGEMPPNLDTPLLCGMTPMELAIRPGKTASVRWLVAHGATLEIIHAWDLGWKDRIPPMLADNPALANHRMGPWGLTPLHEAASRGDAALARLLLTARPDTTLQDTQFQRTALGWARHLGQTEIAALLEEFDSGLPA